MKNIIQLEVSDILCFEGDAIVNPANRSLLRGSGLCGAIYQAAGTQELLAACLELGGCESGDAKTTAAFRLPAKWIIHTAVPSWHRHTPSESHALLRKSYQAIFREAGKYKMQRIAIPAIGTGINGFPSDIAAQISAQEVTAGVHANPTLTEVRLIFSEIGKYKLSCQVFNTELLEG